MAVDLVTTIPQVVMEEPFKTRIGWTRKYRRDGDPEPHQVIPYGVKGGGVITAHPAGIPLVAAVLIIFLVGVPATRWFVAAALASGALVGLILWLRHR